MNSNAPSPNVYPAYCHYLSPTVLKFCPLRAVDVHSLSDEQGMFIKGLLGLFNSMLPLALLKVAEDCKCIG